MGTVQRISTSGAIGNSANSSMDIVLITGDGVNTDFTMPTDTDVAGSFLITNNSLDAVLVDDGGKLIRFSVIPTVEQSTYVLYTKTV